MEKTRKWRWGVNRWIVLGLILLSVVGTIFYSPARPHIAVAPESIMKEPLFTLPVIGDLYLTNTLLVTFLVDIIIIVMAWMIWKSSKSGSLVPSGIGGAMETLLEVIYNLTESSAGKHAKKIFPWFATILLLVLLNNLVKLIPGFETIGLLEHSEHGAPIQELSENLAIIFPQSKGYEGGYLLVPFLRGASTDLNFTLSLALISVFMTQVIGVQTQGALYFSKFLNFLTMFKKPFFGFMDFLVGLLELISEMAKILSFTFRLFGVMFAGTVLVAVVGSMVPVFMPSMIYMFELFMGLIQAFVFGMLTMVFMAQATRGHGGEGHEEHAA